MISFHSVKWYHITSRVSFLFTALSHWYPHIICNKIWYQTSWEGLLRFPPWRNSNPDVSSVSSSSISSDEELTPQTSASLSLYRGNLTLISSYSTLEFIKKSIGNLLDYSRKATITQAITFYGIVSKTRDKSHEEKKETHEKIMETLSIFQC